MHKFLAFDLDGTLLTSRKTIDAETKKMISYLNGMDGRCVILISGRHFYEMRSFIKDLELSGECYFVSSDGQYIYSKDYICLYTAPFIEKCNAQAFLCQNSYRNALIVTDQKDYLIEKRIGRLVLKRLRARIKKLNINILSEKGIWNQRIDDIEKIIVNGMKNQCVDKKFCIHEHSNGNVELLDSNVNKYNALKTLSDRKLIDLNDLLYFGDDMNDFECFSNIRDTVAMGGAADVIKKMAKYETADCDHKGVLEALYKLEN